MTTTTTIDPSAIAATFAAHRKEILSALRRTPAEFHRTVCIDWDGTWVGISTAMTRGSWTAFEHNGEGATLRIHGDPFLSYECQDEEIDRVVAAAYEGAEQQRQDDEQARIDRAYDTNLDGADLEDAYYPTPEAATR
jgi:hypothetical protein